MKKIDRIGEINYNNFGSVMKITNYRKTTDIDVYFEEYNWTKEHTQYNNFKKGNVKCPYERRFYNKGYIAEGKYKVKINRKPTKHYQTWQAMLKRAYDPKYIQKYPTYKGCKVYPEWHNFQIFSEWLDENYYEIEGERMELDKDILIKGNKIYSPENCVFVPRSINTLFIKSNGRRGNLPVGVTHLNKKYRACYNMDGKLKYLGCYNTPDEAFKVYKNFKEKHIKEIAEEYKNVIPQKLYEAMLRYEVDIDD